MWLEDLSAGQVIETEGATLSEAQILDFALLWDPQPFHLDIPAAEAGPFDGLISSGFHSLLVSFRLVQATGLYRGGGAGSPGMSELRWLKPVRPGDTIRARVAVVEARESASKPDRGVVTFDHEVFNQRDELVLTWRAAVMFLKRSAG